MSITRRGFLKSATTTTISAGLALTSANLIFGQGPRRVGVLGTTDGADNLPPLEAQKDALFNFDLSTFESYVGDIFQVPNARGEMITLKLVRAKEFQMSDAPMQKRRGRSTRGFSLTFNAEEALPKFTSIHKMSHPALGNFDLFLTSTETKKGTFVYEAVFNKLL